MRSLPQKQDKNINLTDLLLKKVIHHTLSKGINHKIFIIFNELIKIH